MMPINICPIPYQGSKRLLAPKISQWIPEVTKCGRLIEPFAGSGAISLYAAHKEIANSFILADILEPLMGIWELIINSPEQLVARYEELWISQLEDPETTYYKIRDEYNANNDPARLLYLIVRCVKNAVRFNNQGTFNQSPDKRRLGMKPDNMRQQVFLAHQLLRNKTKVISGDYKDTLRMAKVDDVVYMDPPYQGTIGGSRRYVSQIEFDEFIGELRVLNRRGISFLLSFDGTCGTRRYGKMLPKDLGLFHLSLPAGRSSQATLLGRNEKTVESLYVSPVLYQRLSKQSVNDGPCQSNLAFGNDF